MKLFKFAQQAVRSAFKVGDSVKEIRIITQKDLDNFSEVSGDHNPIHKKFADNTATPIVHGAFLNSIVSAVIGNKMPGHGTIVISQTFAFPSKCYIDVPIEISVELQEIRKILKVKYECRQNDKIVFEGDAKLMMVE